MPQDRLSGARANEYGHETSRKIAEKMNAVSVTDNSNEFAFEGRLITIRCAQKGNNQVGCLYTMLERVDAVFAAFEKENNIYEIFEISPALYKYYARDSKNEGRIGLVTINDFKRVGKPLKVVTI